MAELTAETTAILDRLKQEGQLTRNSGVHSIRSVKIQLDRFEGIFNSISANISEQTEILRKSLNINEEARESQRRKEDLSELDQNAPTPPVPTPPTPDPSPEGKDGKGLFELMGGVGKSLLGIGGKLALGGAGLFVAYNFAKGFIDEKTGGGFTKFEDSMIDTFKEMDWNALGNSFKEFASAVPEAVTSILEFLSDPLNVILGGAGLTAAGILAGMGGGALARGVTRGLIDGVLGGGRGGAGGGQGGLLNARGIARTASLGILAGGLITYGDEIKSWLQQQGANEDVANISVDIGQGAATGATIGSFFGPKGALVGAAVGAGFMILKNITGWIDEQINGTEEDIKARTEAERTAAESLKEQKKSIVGDLGDEANLTEEERVLAAEAASRGTGRSKEELEALKKLGEGLEGKIGTAADEFDIAVESLYQRFLSGRDPSGSFELIAALRGPLEKRLDEILSDETLSPDEIPDYVRIKDSINKAQELMLQLGNAGKSIESSFKFRNQALGSDSTSLGNLNYEAEELGFDNLPQKTSSLSGQNPDEKLDALANAAIGPPPMVFNGGTTQPIYNMNYNVAGGSTQYTEMKMLNQSGGTGQQHVMGSSSIG